MIFIEKRRPKRDLRFEPLERRALLSGSGSNPWTDPNSPNPVVLNPVLMREYSLDGGVVVHPTPYTDPLNAHLDIPSSTAGERIFPVPDPNGLTAVPAVGIADTSRPVARFVDGLYIDLLGRSPSPSDLAFWTRMDHRFGNGFVTRQITNSAESQQYMASASGATAAAGGFPSPSNPPLPLGPNGGLPAGVFNLPVPGADGASGVTAATAPAAVPTNGSGAQAAQSFVTSLYTSLLHRPPDASGEAFWVNLLDAGVSKRAVRAGFLNSPKVGR